MSKWEMREGSGSLFRNEKKEAGDRSPDYKGDILVGGVNYFISGWIKVGSKGAKFMSLAVRPKDATLDAPRKQESLPVVDGGVADLGDDIPF